MRRKILSALLVGSMAAAACGDAGDTTTTVSAATPVTTTEAPTTTTAASTTAAQGTATTTTTTTPAATTTTTAPPVLDPPFDTWTVIVASLSVEEFTEADARARLDELGPPNGGLLLSSDYPSLNPGYWVVYSGVFDRDSGARDHCAALAVDCYHRYLGALADTAPILANGQALLWLQTDFLLDLAVVSLETGEVVRTVAEERGEAEFPDQPVIAPGGRSAFLGIGFEDFWFSCEATLGEAFRVDLETGRFDDFVAGIDPIISPDGRYLAWSEAPECLEDPVEPMFFIAYHEVIVVRDLETGEERRWGPSDAITAGPESIVLGKGWSADSERLYFQLLSGMRELRVDGPTDIATDEHQVIPLFGYTGAVSPRPIGQLQSGELVIAWSEGEETFRSGVDLYDLVAGERTTLVQGEGFFPAAVDGTASAVAWAEGSRLRSVGSVEIDIDVGSRIHGIGW